MRFNILFMVMFFISNQAIAKNGEYEWIQYVHNSQLSARATTLDLICPLIKVDGEEFRMHLRSEQDDINLQQTVRVCDYNVTTAKQVSIRDIQLKLIPEQIKRFIVIGDTGCEASIFDKHHVNQNCSDPKAWPLAAIANKVASLNPDFVIHLGDYVYGNKYTNEADAGKNQQMQWYFFEKEFFKPTKKLLNKAPMIFVRGNHESCATTGKGWYSFLDPQLFKASCEHYSPAYNIAIHGLNFMVFDSAEVKTGPNYAQEQLAKYQADFNKIAESMNHSAILLIHHPILGLQKLSDNELFSPKLNAPILNKAFGQDFTKKMPIAISGHFHLSAQVNRQSDNFQQFIIGNSATLLHKAKRNAYAYHVGDENGSVGVNKHGYTQFDHLEGHLWKVTSYALDGSVLFVNEISLDSSIRK